MDKLGKSEETLAAGDEEGQEDNSSTAAKRKRQPDASPIEFHRRTLAGGTVWDSLINLEKIIELLVRKNEVSGIQVVKHPWEKFAELMQSKENDSLTRKRIDPALLHLIEAMQGVWGKENPLEEAQELVSTAVEARETKKKEELESGRKKI